MKKKNKKNVSQTQVTYSYLIRHKNYMAVRGQSPSPLMGMFFFFTYISTSWYHVCKFVFLFVCLSHFLGGAVGGARFIYYNVINTFKQCGVCL